MAATRPPGAPAIWLHDPINGNFGQPQTWPPPGQGPYAPPQGPPPNPPQ